MCLASKVCVMRKNGGFVCHCHRHLPVLLLKFIISLHRGDGVQSEDRGFYHVCRRKSKYSTRYYYEEQTDKVGHLNTGNLTGCNVLRIRVNDSV
ncbi:hypothetical protein SUGI_0364460 [Cryptomeria japonica]|nr:hypothetical protein SUGI_0364460 [Cryptomeria japonica]